MRLLFILINSMCDGARSWSLGHGWSLCIGDCMPKENLTMKIYIAGNMRTVSPGMILSDENRC